MTNVISKKCWVCDEYLENWKIEMQKLQRFDIHFRIHEGKCRDYFSLVSVKALGQDPGIVIEVCKNSIDDQSNVDVTHHLESHLLPSPQQRTRALPLPEELLTVPQNKFRASLKSMDTGRKIRVTRK
jgi:hypothetical protein